MNETPNVFDVQTYTAERAKFKRLASKFGIAMIALVLNSKLAPYVFIFIAALFSPSGELSYSAIMILNELSAYFFPIVIFGCMFADECKAFVPDRSYKPFKGEAVLMFAAGMSAGALGTMLTLLINSVIDSIFGTGEIEKAFAGMEPQNMGEFAIFAFCICIVAPIAEEYIFRSLLLKPLRAYGDLTAAVVSGVIFGLYHGNFDQFAYAAILGTFFSIIAVRYNSIAPTVILHAANNIIVTCGSDLPAACENLAESIKSVCLGISSVCSALSTTLMIFGFAALIMCLLKKSFTLHNHNRFVPQPRSLLDFASTPLVLAGTAVMLLMFFI